jgi:hypothetical protein
LVSDATDTNESAGTLIGSLCSGSVYSASARVRARRGVGLGIGLSDGLHEATAAIASDGRWHRLSISKRLRTPTALIEIYPVGRVAATVAIDDVALRRGRSGRGGTGSGSIAPAGRGSSGAPTAGPSAQAGGPHGVELLPGRFAQLRLALRLSVHSGLRVALVGRGIGASTLDPRYQLAQAVPLPQRTGSIWLGVLLTDTGWVGTLAFFGLLGWLVHASRRLWRAAASTDRLLAAALPGLVVLTLLASVFSLVLQARSFSLIFWILVGLTMSAVADQRQPNPARAGNKP